MPSSLYATQYSELYKFRIDLSEFTSKRKGTLEDASQLKAKHNHGLHADG